MRARESGGRSSAGGYSFIGRERRRRSRRPSSRSSSPSRSARRRSLARPLNAKALVATARAAARRGARASEARPRDRARARSPRARAQRPLQPLRPLFQRDRYEDALASTRSCARDGARVAAGRVERPRRGRRIPSSCSAAGTRPSSGPATTRHGAGSAKSAMLAALPTICVNRGIDAGLARLEALAAELVDTSDVQRTGGRAVALAVLRGGEGNHAEALGFAKDAVRQGFQGRRRQSSDQDWIRPGRGLGLRPR